jgi:hypothetical protein
MKHVVHFHVWAIRRSPEEDLAYIAALEKAVRHTLTRKDCERGIDGLPGSSADRLCVRDAKQDNTVEVQKPLQGHYAHDTILARGHCAYVHASGSSDNLVMDLARLCRCGSTGCRVLLRAHPARSSPGQ